MIRYRPGIGDAFKAKPRKSSQATTVDGGAAAGTTGTTKSGAGVGGLIVLTYID